MENRLSKAGYALFCKKPPIFAVGKGFIHTYVNVEEAFSKIGFNKKVYECVIPKGCEYYKDFETSELASKVIRFVRKIEPRYEKFKF